MFLFRWCVNWKGWCLGKGCLLETVSTRGACRRLGRVRLPSLRRQTRRDVQPLRLERGIATAVTRRARRRRG